MPNNLNSLPFPTMKRVAQQTVAHCGPATVEMLLSYLDFHTSQNQIVDAAQVARRLQTHGTTIPELAKAVNILFPELQFWYKYNSTISELSRIINDYQFPIGVEWQGIFDWPDDDDDNDDDDYDDDEDDYGEEDDDPGHYGVVTYVSTQDNILLIADPERHYAGTDRNFSVLQFEHRWWDINNVTDPQTGHSQEVDDYHALFIITPKDVTFPEQLHMIRSQSQTSF